MGTYDGGMTQVDSSGWSRPVSGKDGEPHPAPTPMQRNEDTGLMERAPTPAPRAWGWRRHRTRRVSLARPTRARPGAAEQR